MRSASRIFILATVIMSLVGCGKMQTAEGGSTDVEIPGDMAGAGGSLKLMQAGTLSQVAPFSDNAAVVFTGGWSQACVDTSSGGTTSSMTAKMAVTLNMAYVVIKLYTSSNCDAASLALTTTEHYQFQSLGTLAAAFVANSLKTKLIWASKQPAQASTASGIQASCGGTVNVGDVVNVSNCDPDYTSHINIWENTHAYKTDGALFALGPMSGLPTAGQAYYFTKVADH